MQPQEEQHPHVKHLVRTGIHWPRKELSKAPGKGKTTGKPQQWFKGRPKSSSTPVKAVKKTGGFGF